MEWNRLQGNPFARHVIAWLGEVLSWSVTLVLGFDDRLLDNVRWLHGVVPRGGDTISSICARFLSAPLIVYAPDIEELQPHASARPDRLKCPVA